MKIIDNLHDGLPIYEALSSKIRLDITELLIKNHEMNMNDISSALNISQSTLTPHMKKLEQAGIVSIRISTKSRGSQKLCRVTEDKLIINIIKDNTDQRYFEYDLDVGKYSDYNISPTCGLSTKQNLVGELDDIRAFSDPNRFDASIIWFTEGYVTYRFPNQLKKDVTPIEIQLYTELCSEAAGVVSYYPSDIYYSINDVKIGYWTSPGELFDRPGRLTPSWWFKNFPQYGRMKIITVNETGSYLDGLLFSSIKIQDLNLTGSEITVKLEVPSTAKNVGGITLFGHNFGDYDVGVKIKVLYR